ncbi:MaoC family dehydratase [Candidatus Sumerlaeota bacterium]|nr:MaoC family dehydratase [Candidatus Sumerlaeota bacterium]
MSSQAGAGPYFEDFEIGRTIKHAVPRTLTEGDNALYIALTGDRHPLHCDAGFARRLGFRREILNDLLVFHVVFGKTVPDISAYALANLGYADVRFLRPVYPGDTLRSVSEIVGKKENSNGKTGNLYVHTRGQNQRGETVVQFYRWVMLRKRDETVRSGERSIPDLPSEVALADLPIPEELRTLGFTAAATGGARFFGDYEPGERILHGGGMTIEEAEHALATRLYQNTARVHFDAHFMKSSPAGKRLIYGGHIISLARAMAFQGLENAIRMLAWNGGTHANPTYAGDTIYALTDVISKSELPDHPGLGALRLRLIALKNQDPATEPPEIEMHDEKKGKTVYHPNVVLDLDYYVLMPMEQPR